jgi:endonuclease YncB( thermonuclease family)
MLKYGYAEEYTFIWPYGYQDDFKAVEANARKEGRGLWSACFGSTK